MNAPLNLKLLPIYKYKSFDKTLNFCLFSSLLDSFLFWLWKISKSNWIDFVRRLQIIVIQLHITWIFNIAQDRFKKGRKFGRHDKKNEKK